MPNFTHLIRGTLVAGFLVLLGAGCSGNSKVQGTVKYKGQPVEGATVSLVTDDGTIVASGQSDATGTFKLMTPQGKDSIPPGTYKATVTKLDTPKGMDPDQMKPDESGKINPDMIKMMKGMRYAKSALPEKYRTKESTTLKVTIPSKDPINLDLDG
jgi:Protein of unknown function (DUF1416)